jgi:hypothetical protein
MIESPDSGGYALAGGLVSRSSHSCGHESVTGVGHPGSASMALSYQEPSVEASVQILSRRGVRMLGRVCLGARGSTRETELPRDLGVRFPYMLQKPIQRFAGGLQPYDLWLFVP